jgi:plastocyanin
MLSFMRKLTVLFIVLICMALVCGCTTPSSSSQPAAQASQPVIQSAAPAAGGPTVKVHITATSFDPHDTYITAGTTVTWINEDKMSHRVEHLPQLPSDKLLFRSESLSPGESFSYTFIVPGRYVYGDPQHGGGRSPFVNVS